MRKFLKNVVVLMFILTIIFITACTKQSKETTGDPVNSSVPTQSKETTGDAANSAAPTQNSEKIKVGFDVPDLENPFFISVTKTIKEGLEKQGVDLMVVSSNGDVNKQIANIENMVASKVKVIITVPLDPNSIEDVLKKARDAGVKVHSFGTVLVNADSIQTTDRIKMGRMMGIDAAKWINEKLGGKAEIGLIVSTSVIEFTDRTKGLEDALKRYAPNAKVVAKQEATTIAEAQKVAENMLLAHPNIKVIVTAADLMGIGAYEAVKASGKSLDDFYINGLDGSDEALAKVKEGSAFRATLDRGNSEIPKLAIDATMKLIKGESFQRIQETTLTVVDSTNIDKYIVK
jgi:ribose transport system substrate-binding protein